MKLVVGLGNPGDKYRNNRHNIGFILLDRFANDNQLEWKFEKKFEAEIARLKTPDKDLLLVKPQTFMNNSGEAVRKILDFYNIPPKDVLVVHDEIDLPAGTTKMGRGMGSAGHKGVQSLIDHLGANDFERLRVGVGRPENPNIDIEDWVLMDFDHPLITSLEL